VSSTQLMVSNGVININHHGDDVTLAMLDMDDEGIHLARFTAAEAADVALELIRRSNGLDDEQMAKIRMVVPVARAKDMAAVVDELVAAEVAADRRDAVEELYAPHWTGGRSPIFECHDGWLNILADLIPKLVAADPDVRVGQVKEKFGAARVYVDVETELVTELIMEAERVSMGTCEVCGEPGRLGSHNNWWSARCGACQPDGWEPGVVEFERRVVVSGQRNVPSEGNQ